MQSRRPRQTSLPFPPLSKSKRAAPADLNQAAAEIILADPERYGGPEALPVVWARRIRASIAGTGLF
jgi:hypothetical protein